MSQVTRMDELLRYVTESDAHVQCVAVCCSVCCSVLRCVAVCAAVCVAVFVAVCCSVCCSILQHVAVCVAVCCSEPDAHESDATILIQTPYSFNTLPIQIPYSIRHHTQSDTLLIQTHYSCTHPTHAFRDGYCSTVQGLLDLFEVDLGFPELVLFRHPTHSDTLLIPTPYSCQHHTH